MSAQYKLKKYMSKIESAKSVDNMNTYYKKLLKYKFPQAGGVQKEQMPWNTNLDQFIKKISDLKGLEELSSKTEEIKQIQEKLKKLVEMSKDYQDTLKYALEDIKKVTDTNVPDVAGKIGEISNLLKSLQVGDISGKSANDLVTDIWKKPIMPPRNMPPALPPRSITPKTMNPRRIDVLPAPEETKVEPIEENQ